ncbi:MAG: hypothetical protein AAFX65_09655 [Cyanobacteria bacterium J06638_7]
MPAAVSGSAPGSATPSHGDSGWSDSEQLVARRAFDRAQQRTISALVQTVQAHAQGLDSVDSVWTLHDFLSIQRHAIEGRFDFRLPGLLFVFASLVRDELLSIDELEGLHPVKLAKITAMSRM